jgi:hypothetical protein
VVDEEEPAIGRALPRADEAVIDPAKLVDYALDPTHPRGRHKAVVFNLALGIQQRDWAYLRDRILEALPHHPVSGVRRPERPHQRTTWEVLVPVRGLNGRVLLVVTAWWMVAGRPELESTRVVRKRHQPDGKRTTL